MSLFLQGKKIVKKVKSSCLYCLVFNIFVIKSQPSHPTKASKSASNDTASLYQSTIKLKRMSQRARKENIQISKRGVKRIRVARVAFRERIYALQIL